MTTIDTVLKDIYLESPLYGEIMLHCKRFEDNSLKYIAAVSPKLEMYVNPDLFGKLTDKQKKAVIKHEILHLMMSHFSRFKVEFEKFRRICNIAMDCAINQLIVGLPKGCVTLDTIRAMTGKVNVESKRESEYYYKLLMVAYNEQKDKLEGMLQQMGDNDGHEKMFEDSELSVFEQTFLDSVIDSAIEKQQLEDAKRGTTTANEVLKVLPKREKCIDKNLWKCAVNKFFGEEPKGNHEYRYGRQSRRDLKSMFGKVRTLESSHLYVGIDTSGSVSNEDLARFVSQINAGMKASGTVVTVIQCDTEVKSAAQLRRIPAGGFSVKGRGGTDLTGIVKWIVANRPASEKVSNLLLLTDGDTPWKVDASIKTTAIYTRHHSKIKGIDKFAVLH